jgi:hypothetical protein
MISHLLWLCRMQAFVKMKNICPLAEQFDTKIIIILYIDINGLVFRYLREPPYGTV